MKWCIGEKIKNVYTAYIVALPKNSEDKIKVSYVPVLCITGTFYYNDNTAEALDGYKTLLNALTPEWAEKRIPGYEKGMKLLPVYGISPMLNGEENADKANDKLRNKLQKLTKHEFYNKRW